VKKLDVLKTTNTIFYGPPGTGKTFETASRAVQLCDGVFANAEDRALVMKRYEELRAEGRVTFVTFHQSYGYEEFVEGLRPSVGSTGQVSYGVTPGVFRRACDAARLRQLLKPGLLGVPLHKRTIWKMSLGASWSDEGSKVFQYGLENQCILLGYGDDVDFDGCADESEIKNRINVEIPDIKKVDSHAWHVNAFKNELKVGDVVIVSDGNKSFRAIAEVTGDYDFIEDAPFHQVRPVKWLAVFEPSKPVKDIFHKGFSMQTLYRLNPIGLNFQNLDTLLSAAVEESPVKPHVLIIDEINRANISKVFGELITLLEPDKREGCLNAITVKLPYSGDDFTVPANLHIIGTMNTADRSIALLDTALRRRFDFEELAPDPAVLRRNIDGVDLALLLTHLNRRIEVLFDRDHRIGHAFFMQVGNLDDLENVFRRKVLPLLQEYFFENWSNVRRVLNDYGDGDFITRERRDALPADGEDSYAEEPRMVYRVNEDPFAVVAYQRIYAGA
jgi:5-methylcytosine-specific restriction protein B